MAKIPVTGTASKRTTASPKTTPARARKTTPSKAATNANAAADTGAGGSSAVETTVSLPELRKKDLIDAVVERSGIKKKYAKPAIEAALVVLGEALDEKRTLNLPPMGKMKVQRTKEIEDGMVLAARIRRKNVHTSDTPQIPADETS